MRAGREEAAIVKPGLDICTSADSTAIPATIIIFIVVVGNAFLGGTDATAIMIVATGMTSSMDAS